MAKNSDPIRVCIPVHGPKFEQMYELSRKVAERFVPEATLFAHHYTPESRYTEPPHAGDWAKAEATSLYTEEGPVFVMDVDAVLVLSPRWKFKNKKAVLSISSTINVPLVLPQDRGLQIIQNVAVYAGLLQPGETAHVNPQFFWATENLLPLYGEMDSVFCEYMIGHPKDEFMRSLAIWAMTWLKLKEEGKIEDFPIPHPVWHCPMLPQDRLSIHQIFTDWLMKQPVDSPEYPPGSLFGV